MERIHYINSEERTMSMLCHLSALAMFIIPFGSIVGPLIVWLSKKDQYPEVDRQGKDALNFHISMLLYIIVSAILVILVIGFMLLIALGILNLVIIIIAAVKSNSGERFEYPLSIRFIV
jgi:uncharacterized Tic20 family protein